MTSYFVQAFIYLIAAVIVVPLAKRAGLGSVMGYLIAGILIGPVLGLVGHETVTIQHFAEFGVVMMLFLVGLELAPNMLWQMKSKLLGLGGLQLALTTLVLASISLLFEQTWQVSLAIGLIFSLSSTAIILQTFNEKKLTNTQGGKNAFSVLLFQDIAVIPMLAFIPLLGVMEISQNTSQEQGDNHNTIGFIEQLSTSMHMLLVVGVIVSVIVAGHYFSRPLFRYVAKSGLREIFVAMALMVVIGISALMGLVGLSPALGTFIAGVVLANSEFRHELESNIEPFKGLLLGLFFITVGAGVDFAVFAESWLFIIGAAIIMMLIKALVLYIIMRAFCIKGTSRWLFSLSLAQAGEFGFVLLNYSSQYQVFPPTLSEKLQLVVALSMFLTPILFVLLDKVIFPRFEKGLNEQEADEITEQGRVIIAGTGRFGQVINRFLIANDIDTVVLDREANQVEHMRQINIKSFFGDATRPELLETAGIDSAAMIVIAIDDKEDAVMLTEFVRSNYPNITILSRAFDRGHSYQLKNAGADFVIVETYFSALEAGGKVLEALDMHAFQIKQKMHTFKNIEDKVSHQLFEQWEKGSHGQQFDQGFKDLFIQFDSMIKTNMQDDGFNHSSKSERGWAPPPKDYQTQLTKAFDEK